MKRRNVLGAILTVAAFALVPGCGLMQAKTDVVLEPQGATAFERALDYEEQQEFDLAAAEYQVALVKDPGDSRAWVNLGLLHQRAGRTRHAVACWQKAVTANPTDARAYNLLGNVWMENNDYSKAVAYYRRASEADPQFADPHWNMGAALRHMNREDEAADAYRAFIQLAGDTQREDVDKATVFVAQLGGTGLAPAHRFVTETPAVAEAEPSADEPFVDIVLSEKGTTAVFPDEVAPSCEPEAEPDAIDGTVDEEAPDYEMMEPGTPAEGAAAPVEGARAPVIAADNAAQVARPTGDGDPVDPETQRIADELDRLERESKARVQADQ